MPNPITHHSPTNGVRLHCLEWPGPERGPRDPGPAVVLLHGLTSCAETWSFVAPALAADARVLAPDLRGHGESEKPDSGYDYGTLAADLAGLLDSLGVEKAAMVGHSWGASVGWGFTLAHPERVTHLALVEGGFFRGPGPVEATEERLEGMLAPLHIYASRETYLDAVRSHFPGPWTPELERIALASIHENGDGTVREKLSRDHQKLILRAMLGGLPGDRYALRCPVLVLLAENNDPALAERMARRREAVEHAAGQLPRCTVRWVPGSIHDIQLHRPELVVEALRALVGV